MRVSPSFLPRLKREEGFSPSAYWDNKHWSWGYGTPAPGKDAMITEERATDEMLTYVSMAEGNYMVVFQKDPPGLTPARYDSIIIMLYNLGLAGFSEFSYTIGAIKEGNWIRAASHAQQSLWYRQVGGRARQVVEEFRTGVSQEYPTPVPTPVAEQKTPVPVKIPWYQHIAGLFLRLIGGRT